MLEIKVIAYLLQNNLKRLKRQFFKGDDSGTFMSEKKSVRTKGKISFSRYFQEFKEGERAAVVKEISMFSSFPKNIQGRTGVIEKKIGRSYMIKIKDKNKEKKYIIAPMHLKKIN